METFTDLAARPDAHLDELALALAAEFRDDVDARWAINELDELGAELADTVAGARSVEEQAILCGDLLGGLHGFAGDQEEYDHPDNSMLDLVLRRRTGLPIALSVVYVEVARRADLPLVGIGLPGHFVVAHAGARLPLLLDPFAGGGVVDPPTGTPPELLRPWTPHETAMRMLNNLVNTFARRGALTDALHAADLRLALPADEPTREALKVERRAMRARLN